MIELIVASQLFFQLDKVEEITHEEYINNQWQTYFVNSGCSSKTNIRESGLILCSEVVFNKEEMPREGIKLKRIENINFMNVKNFNYNAFNEIQKFGSFKIEHSEIDTLGFIENKELDGMYYMFGFNSKLKDLSFFDKIDFSKMKRVNIFSYYHDQDDKDGLYNLPDKTGLFCYYQRSGKIRSFYNNVGIEC